MSGYDSFTMRFDDIDVDELYASVHKDLDAYKLSFREEPKTIVYKYNELNLINELLNYVNETYGQHYSQSKFQTTEFIIDNGHGMGFCLGNVTKYAQRYGKKDGYNRKDLMKVLHYALIALHTHDLEHGNTSN